MNQNIGNIGKQIHHRKLLKWSPHAIPGHKPPIDDTLRLFDKQVSLINYGTPQNKGNSWKNIKHDFKSVFNMKLKLDDKSRPLIHELNPPAKEWFLHDLLFIAGLGYYLKEVLIVLEELYPNSHLPSHLTCAVSHLRQQLESTIKMDNYYSSHTWLQPLLHHIPKLELELDIILKNCQSDEYLLSTSVQRIKKCPPPSLIMERYFLHILREYNSSYESEDLSIRLLNRQNLATTLALSMITISESQRLIESYLNDLGSYLISQEKCTDEMYFWELYYSLIKSTMPDEFDLKEATLLKIKQLQSSIKEMKNYSDTPHTKTPFVWHGSTMEFAKHFHTLLSNRQMSLNGYFDIEPFVKELHRVISVKKDKGSGYLSYNSLLTYFKQLNAELN